MWLQGTDIQEQLKGRGEDGGRQEKGQRGANWLFGRGGRDGAGQVHGGLCVGGDCCLHSPPGNPPGWLPQAVVRMGSWTSSCWV